MSIATLFETAFGSATEAVFSAPGRVNLIGEHTDYNGGLALPFAIADRTTIAIRVRDDGRIRLVSESDPNPIESTLAEALGTGPISGWGAYVLGVVRVVGSIVGAEKLRGFDAFVTSTIPLGAGLSSSHSLECATATALVDLFELPLSRADLIGVTLRVEHEVVGAPTGTLDQSAILLSQPDHAVLLDFAASPAAPRPVRLGFAEASLEILVCNSNQAHDHSTGGYRQRRAECESGAAKLGVSLLAEASSEQLEAGAGALTDVEYRRARHIITETARVRAFAAAVEAGAFAEAGELLVASHASQRDDFECSTPAINAAVEAALAAGALGARLTGGGFGGSSIALVPAASSEQIATAIGDAVEAAGFPRPTVLRAQPSDGAHRDS